MKKRISWAFSEQQRALVRSKSRSNQLYVAVQLKYYETHREFLKDVGVVSSKTISKVAKEFGVFSRLKELSEKSIYTYKQENRDFFKTQHFSPEEATKLKECLIQSVLPKEDASIEQLKEKVATHLSDKRYEKINEKSIERLVRSARTSGVIP